MASIDGIELSEDEVILAEEMGIADYIDYEDEEIKKITKGNYEKNKTILH